MSEGTLVILLVALVLDWRFGEPEVLWSRLPHPVVIFGRAVGFIDKRFNLESDDDALRYRKGALGIAALVVLAITLGYWLQVALSHLWLLGAAIEIFIVFALLAQRSLITHVEAVADALGSKVDGPSGLDAGRAAVGMIVGRDPASLDRSGVSRAAIESLAENFSDGVVTPAFWYAVFGLPGLLAYKLINTADSMIGYRNERYESFGKTAAKVDDLANWLPARLSAVLIALTAAATSSVARGKAAMAGAIRDAGLHRSPNAGWPEAACAHACGFALGGPRIYPSGRVEQAYLNATGKLDLDGADIDTAIALISKACIAGWGLVALGLVLF